jgi:peroxin-16
VADEVSSLAHIDKMKVLSEILLILRPLLYVTMIRRYGLRSWKPWLSALAVDATGMAILYGATLLPKQALGGKSKPTTNMSTQEKNEVSVRSDFAS